MKLLVIHGPNLNLLGQRETDVYGSTTFDTLCAEINLIAKRLEIEIIQFQSNHEGAIIDTIQSHFSSVQGIVINPGALTHTSIALRDALLSVSLPFVEVHLSNVFSRETFRHQSYISDISIGLICGFGTQSYLMGIQALMKHLE